MTVQMATRPTAAPITPMFGLLMRGVLTVAGAALVMAAFGLWLVPGEPDAPALSLIRLGVSLFMLISGMCSLVISRSGRG
ncbi:hypothetical protein [Tropicibacter naphthalenivorans]|uniref:Uncharacterized protein n=1 Tax=Tropicibacter naphthalenivorans TaxID=441103 RepID=A0A0P1GF51_9RHOB|nr:hypothetical protein [Tropicibacter naphthalenivorans]CUH80104.1 hypothetical protein TRN7648_02821 [Tropicibacter naphthalenivorans]SMC84683.1 hypothetical protein SAMN04488093_10590 [Tropicibacter naphthalenivorans]